ncbi:TIGR03084 family metal-binding protein [Amycolatopsis palatopharyngis]|uniref:TIGR03084 family metal-binding protein n=1 Tax=Amycolatopsis palatopharyngis TaxID=187982 RepID=UPI000E2438FE|nr:TIGR03084 family metal-binding protein [Amycolatopsis palatopharyngis]
MTGLHNVIADLISEGEEVDRLVADLDPTGWKLPTPAPDWPISHQIGHLAFIFRLAGLAASDPAGFGELTSRISNGFNAAVNAALADYVDDPPETLLARWRAERDAGIKALAAVPEDQMVPWLVNPLPPAVLASAGMMELFGHGQDIADALGVERRHTDRIRHLAGFVVRTWEFGYQARGLTPPGDEFRFEVTTPSGAMLTFGPAEAGNRISGPAVDLCLLATRRRHRDDLRLTATGAAADEWLDIAQAYRGPAGPGREPGQFAQSR